MFVYIYIVIIISILPLCAPFLIAMQHPADRGHMQEETSRMLQFV